MNKYLDIFLTFARVGAFTFGGGYSMLPILQREVVEAKGWVEEREVLDFYSISQVLPGMIGINTAIFIGNKVKGRWGGVLAALGVAFPSLVIIMVLAAFLSNFAEVELVRHAFAGIHVCVFVLIANSVWKLRKGAIVDPITLALFVLVFVLSAFTDFSPILMVVASALIGVALYGKAQPFGGNKP